MATIPVERARALMEKMLPESDDRVFANLPSIADGAIGGVWDANNDIPRVTGHRSNHESWNGKWFAAKDSDLHDLVEHPHGYIGDAYGKPTRPDVDDNIVLPGHAYNCQCSLRLVYDIRDVPEKYLTARGRQSLREGQV
jgi:hypothetical protein